MPSSHSPQGTGTGDAESRQYGTPVDYQTSTKRKRRSIVTDEDRKKVSRACDACKEKKVRCAGTQPCPRCVKHSLQCLYNKEHKRGKPLPPEPGYFGNDHAQNAATIPSVTVNRPSGRQRNAGRRSTHVNPLEASQDLGKSSRSSLEADGARFEGDYIGPTSGIAFLHRAQKRFQQDYAAIKSRDSEHHGSKKESVCSFGDGWLPDYSSSDYVLPSRAVAKGLLDRYFDFAMPTYRFVHRPAIESWLDDMYEEDSRSKPISNAKKAIVNLVLATAKLYNQNVTDSIAAGRLEQSEEIGILFAEAERLLSTETGPVRLESVQARLAQCIHLLASSRINQAWYIFGTVTQMITAIGLHRKPQPRPHPISTVAPVPEDTDIKFRRRVFWSAYTLDRYLSVMLGRPRIFRDEDIDQLPEIATESEFKATLGSRTKQSVWEGPIFHARLARILGAISGDLYPTNRLVDGDWVLVAGNWTIELKNWRASLPAFLDPDKVDPSMLIPIFQRQSTVLSLAYAHAMILANRPALLSNFAELNRAQGIPRGEPKGSLKECVDAALVVVVTVNDLIEAGQMRKAFWFTHYISFCAISALYVYTIQQCLPQQAPLALSSDLVVGGPDTQHFEAASKCQKRIEDTTTISSPFRRYNIILDELKKEVQQHLGSLAGSMNRTVSREQPNLQDTRRSHGARPQILEPDNFTASATPGMTSLALNPVFQTPVNSSHQEGQYPSLEISNAVELGHGFVPQDAAGPSTLDSSMPVDLSVFGFQGELMGWSEFDSCAINWPEGFEDLDLAS